jgi:GlpG protein
MRMIGQLPDKAAAATFSDLLCVRGISNVVEHDRESWSVWVHAEEDLEAARGCLEEYLRNPRDPRYASFAPQAAALRERAQREEEEAARRTFTGREVFRARLLGGATVTLALVAASAVATVLLSFNLAPRLIAALLFSLSLKGMPEILHGEVWRLVTPIFLHASLTQSIGALHLLFNAMWMLDLGRMVELRRGSRFLLLFVVVTAAVSNLAQYFHTGPLFGGLSGVIYGLLGYVWLKGRLDPASGLFLHPQTVMMMLIWFFVCLVGLIPSIANTVHAVGLVIGIGWGWLSSLSLWTRR